MVRDLGIFVSENVFFIAILLRVMKESIMNSISFILAIIDLKIISQQFLGPVNLLKTYAFYIHRMTEIVIVHGNENIMFAIFQVMLPSLQDFENG